jgi:hypothetical protein
MMRLVGHVAPGAGRCAGSRRPDHARGSSFARSQCHALVHPRRAIRLYAGALCGSHQQGHMHISWLSTMFGHRRPRAEHVGRKHWRGDFRATSDTRVHPKVAFAVLWAHRAAGPQSSHFACTVPGSALPCRTCPTRPEEPRLSLAGPRALSLRRVQRPFAVPAPAQPTRSPLLALAVCLFSFPLSSTLAGFAFALFSFSARLVVCLLWFCFRSAGLASRPLVQSRSQRPLDPPGRLRLRS